MLSLRMTLEALVLNHDKSEHALIISLAEVMLVRRMQDLESWVLDLLCWVRAFSGGQRCPFYQTEKLHCVRPNLIETTRDPGFPGEQRVLS